MTEMSASNQGVSPQEAELNRAIRIGTAVWLPLAAACEEDKGLSSQATAFAVTNGMRTSLYRTDSLPGPWENSVATALPRARIELLYQSMRPDLPIKTLCATGKLAITALRIHAALQGLVHPNHDPISVHEQETAYMVSLANEVAIPRFERSKFDTLAVWDTRLGRAITTLDKHLNNSAQKYGLRKADAMHGRLVCQEGLRLFMGTVATFNEPGQVVPVFPAPNTSIEKARPWTNYVNQLI